MIVQSRRIRACGALLLSVAAILPVLAPAALAQEYTQLEADPSAASAPSVRDIQIVGAQRIEPATVLTYLDIKTGDPITQDTLDRAMKSLYGTGFFADVTVSQQPGGVVEVRVTENPVINEIAFEGNEEIEDTQLESEISLRPRQVFSRTRVQSDVSRLYQLYTRSGRFSASIEPKIIKLDQNRVNLVFEIDEGPETDVKSIRFVGNRHFSDDSLREEIVTRESRWYHIMSADDRYDPDRLAYDQEKLRQFYLEQGYADFRVVTAVAELSPDKKSFYITFTVEEGERYRVGKVGVDAQIQSVDPKSLESLIEIASGDWYDGKKVEETVEALTDALGDRQYAFVAVRPDLKRNRDEHTVDVSFRVSETPRVFVERIDVHGNVRTLDEVIRREFQLMEGDPFSKTKLAKSEQRLKDLGFFEKVNIRTLPGTAPDKTIIDVEVAEKSTGEISVGAGFSTADGPLADLSLRERNLLGKGQDLRLSTTIAGRKTEFDVSYTEPYFLGRDLSAGVDAFHITRDLQRESSFDQRRTGGGFRVGYPLSENWRQTLRYRLESNEIRNVSDTASRYIRDQEGDRVTSALSQRLVYDARDSKLFPTDGLWAWLDTEVAGLGGDAEFLSGTVGTSWYYPVSEGWTLNLLGETGAIGGLNGENVAINDRFFLGGSTLRGFKRSGVGPRDLSTDDALGGNLFYRGTAEMSFPIGLPEEYGVSGHGFTDLGSLWSVEDTGTDVVDESALRAAAGVGVSWRSPMGPIRIDLAAPYAKQDYDVKETFRFSFGTRF